MKTLNETNFYKNSSLAKQPKNHYPQEESLRLQTATTVVEGVDMVEDELCFEEALTQTNSQDISERYTAKTQDVGLRLDKLASQVFGQFSRAALQKFIESGALTVNGQQVKPKLSIKLLDELHLQAVPSAQLLDLPENIPLEVLYEDDSVLVINKPAGLVVHPGAGNRTGTLVNALLYHYPNQDKLPRAGLVHRIDKDTTGLLVVARTSQAQLNLINQLKDKSVYRHYRAVVQGIPSELAKHRIIDAPIARHPSVRTKMAVRQNGKPAITHLLEIEGLDEVYSLVDVALQTGRTHQIRVHLSSVGHPLLGDQVYAKPAKSTKNKEKQTAIKGFSRQALHAYRLGFVHPVSGEALHFCAPMPEDLRQIIEILKTS